MSFHPDQHLPGCMMPDGGECCAGHAAVCEDWHAQRARIEALEAALRKIAGLVDGEAGEPLADAIEIARAALKEQGK